jgi:hypothetical protein
MGSIKISFTKEEILKTEKSAYRRALVETGCYAIPQHKVHKNKKKYDRNRDKKFYFNNQ